MKTLRDFVVSLKAKPSMVYGNSPSLPVVWAFLLGFDLASATDRAATGSGDLLGFVAWYQHRQGLPHGSDIFPSLREGVSEEQAVDRVLSLIVEFFDKGQSDEANPMKRTPDVCPWCGR